MIRKAIARAVAREDLDVTTMEAAMEQLLSGDATPAQVAGFLVSLSMKGESATEVATGARVMRRHAVRVAVRSDAPLLDTCGTGGSGTDAFNISTVAALVLAACGVRVAKHGNRAASSKCGSADLLEALGIRLDLPPERIGQGIDELGIGFMFAPAHHPAMRHVVPVRSELGIRTLFNFLGPLANPAGASHQVVGVSDPGKLELLARALMDLDVRAWVVHGEGGLDELSLHGTSQVIEATGGELRKRAVSAADYGLSSAPLSALRGGDAADNARDARAILAGEGGPKADAVVLNAAAGLMLVGVESDPKAAAQRARQALADGSAAHKLAAWQAFTRA
ncbi:MAG: anthranilate phosphoribosyltransferase [Myxococcales bacterium]|nr:anthranilate phosphoribosyltransferase [Myxococcales bacterium]